MSEESEEAYAGYLRFKGWKCTPPNPEAQLTVGRNHPDTSHQVQAHLRKSSLRYKMLEAFTIWGDIGATDDELEMWSNRSHQTVSSARNTLARQGLVMDSGERRKTRSGNQSIVWKRTQLDYK